MNNLRKSSISSADALSRLKDVSMLFETDQELKKAKITFKGKVPRENKA
jgi:hypothetical protein